MSSSIVLKVIEKKCLKKHKITLETVYFDMDIVQREKKSTWTKDQSTNTVISHNRKRTREYSTILTA